jgi:tetratricopeptide (TPR) repeat protein
MVDAVYGDPAGAATLADEAIELAKEIGDPDLLLKAYNWKIIAYYHLAWLGQPRGTDLVEQTAAAALLAEDLEQKFWHVANLGTWHLDVADYSNAERYFRQAERLLGNLSAPHLRRVLLTNRGQLELESGDMDAASRYFSESLATEAVSVWKPHRTSALAGLGLCQLHAGRLREARSLAEQLGSKPEPWTFDPTLWLTLEARLALASGTPVRSILANLRGAESLLEESLLIGWMRIRLLRFSISVRRGIAIHPDDIREVESFLADRSITHRQVELARIVKES